MEQQQTGRGSDTELIPLKTEWPTPLVNRLIAGGAEGNAGADVEGRPVLMRE